ncbi:hypothetical protein [Burkholderia cepacia]|uniref:hypothetical protein n=1 Tax=Burkholderia cepacia TaxID=292 RepID=UPI0015764BEF|nr:hypothetical protein [Burkholderia cepacia]NTX23216.1 hypothetical protein [Burkholderia cepacia]
MNIQVPGRWRAHVSRGGMPMRPCAHVGLLSTVRAAYRLPRRLIWITNHSAALPEARRSCLSRSASNQPAGPLLASVLLRSLAGPCPNFVITASTAIAQRRRDARRKARRNGAPVNAPVADPVPGRARYDGRAVEHGARRMDAHGTSSGAMPASPRK